MAFFASQAVLSVASGVERRHIHHGVADHSRLFGGRGVLLDPDGSGGVGLRGRQLTVLNVRLNPGIEASVSNRLRAIQSDVRGDVTGFC